MVAVNYLWNPLSANIVREFDDAGIAVAEYTTEHGEFGNVISQTRSGSDSYQHYDGLGSTLVATNQAATATDTRAYTAFGEIAEQSGSTTFPFQYVGRMGYFRDAETEDLLVRQRHLLVSHGRWLAFDPLALGHTLYTYVGNHSVNLVDPSGMVPPIWCLFRYWGPFRSGKALWDCSVFTPQFNAFEKQCQEETVNIIDLLKWGERCPKQISPIINIGSKRHAELCCILHKAHDDPTIDFETFKLGFANCLQGMKLSLDILNALWPRPQLEDFGQCRVCNGITV